MASMSDWNALSVLFSTVFGHDIDEVTWRHKYLPPSPARAGQILVCHDRTDEPLGHLGFIIWPGIGLLGHAPVLQVMDVMVHPQWRGFMGTERKSVFQFLITALSDELGPLAKSVFAYGFAGLRPFRLGQRLGVYRQVHGCWVNTVHPDPDRSVASAARWTERELELISTTERPDRLLGPIWSLAYLEWRLIRAKGSYQLWTEGSQWAVTTKWNDGEVWCVASSGLEACASLPFPVRVWRRQAWRDRGFGPVKNEPQMIASQVKLSDLSPQWLAAVSGWCEPWSTDVF